MAFMEPEVVGKQEWVGVETSAGFWWVPIDVLSSNEVASARRGDFEPLLKYTEGNKVYNDQSMIKKGYGVRLSARGYMDASDWEVYGSKKEALRRARELAREAEGEDYATKKRARHATKKSPAQLQREIDETLARGNLTPAQREHIALFEQDVREHPGAYKAMVRDDPGAYALLTISGLDDREVRQSTRALRAERKKVARLTGHAKKKKSVWGRVVSSHGLGTADIRTEQGAYWIVERPKGYRVDYKPWGPSSQIDLGMFPSRRLAHEKVADHAYSIGATIVN